MNNKILDNVKKLRVGIKNFLVEEENLPNDAPRKLRGKQTEVFEALLSSEFSDEDIARGYFKLPTGFGKTVMFAHLTKSFLNETPDSKKKILVLVPRINLLEQTDEKFDKFIGVDTSYFYGKEKDTSSRVIISTYQSLSALLSNINKGDIDLVIADEAHHALGEITSKLFEDLQKYAPTIAFTATPNYSNDKKLANLFSKEIYSMTTIDAVQNNMLVPVKNILLRSSIEFDLSQIKKKNDGNFDYEKIANSISMETLSKEIAKAYLYGEDKDEEGNSFRFFGKKAMISCPNVKTAIAQAEKINELAGQVIAKPIFQHMGMSSRFGEFDETVEDFKNNKFLVACQVNTLTEGFDDTGVSISINYPTASAVREEQSAGRALRINEKDPNKVAYVIDTVFSVGNDDENPFETARKAGQVLFSDVAGASVIFPENFKHKKYENDRDEKDKERFPLPPHDIEIPEFKIFTDTEKLLQVFNDVIKDDNYYSTLDLANNKSLGVEASHTTHYKYLNKAYNSNNPKYAELKTHIRKTRNDELRLHKDGLELYKEIYFSNNYYSSSDLANNKSLGVGASNSTHWTYLNEAYKSDDTKYAELKPYIDKTKKGPRLHKDGLELYKEIYFSNNYYSSSDLANNKSLGVGASNSTHWTYLNEAYKSDDTKYAELKPYIDKTKKGPRLHKDGLELYKQIYFSNNWYSATDLANDESLGVEASQGTHMRRLKEAYESDNPKYAELKHYIKETKNRLCLRKDGLELYKEIYFSNNWYSTIDLANDKSLGVEASQDTHWRHLKEAYKKLDDPKYVELKPYIKETKTGLRLHKDGLELYKEIYFSNNWYSTGDLANDKSLGVEASKATHVRHLKEAYESDDTKYAELKPYIEKTKKGLRLHKDGLKLYVQKFNIKIKDPEMFEKAIKKIEQKIAMEEKAQKTNTNIISNKQNDGR